MKYEAVNELSNFDYHDAYINKIDFQNGQMIWEVENINAKTKNSQNNFDSDMCIGNAIMIFKDVQTDIIFSDHFGAYNVYDSNGNLIESRESPVKKTKPEEYNNILKEHAGHGDSIIFGMDSYSVLDGGKYTACFEVTDFRITIIFSKSVITWDNFSGKAWYAREDFVKRSELFGKSWTKLISGNKIGDMIDLTIKRLHSSINIEILQGLTGFIHPISENDVFNVGEVYNVKITDIKEELWQITVDINGQPRQIFFSIPV